ncbi:cuticle protein 6-like [Zootermopsis nevadensis]|uniref:Cuticle protein 6 n=1 Tax=Zootermopsis nevadensis TaxID=136037 RepID=A0A067R3I2_ZOONE|nr:cuticle protein 6-like [Zootermopsis nevadensis]KDR16642.1 Cuticle protein 6 [Zootermopsis nevadensis]
MDRCLQIVLYAVAIGVARARPDILQGYVVPVGLSTQYHAQDALGQYSYGYSDGLSSKNEVKTFDGVTRGGYSYLDSNGLVQSAAYTADAVNGFKVSATNLPVAPKADPADAPSPVQDTPEVSAAKAAHKVAQDAATVAAAAPEVPLVYSAIVPGGFAYSTYGGVPGILAYSSVAPIPLVSPGVPADTPEVAAAKAAHFAAHVEAKLKSLG